MNHHVSVIIPVYNQARFVSEAIESALAQTYSSYEVIVVNDGSTDNTAEVLAAFAGDPRVRIVDQSNRGVAAARNAGAGTSAGDLLAFLDADDVWLPQKLENQVARFKQDPSLGLVHCGVVEIDGNGTPLRERTDGLEGNVALDLLLFERTVILGGGSGAMIPAKVFTEIGGFDERMSTSADWDLFFRIASHYGVGFVPEVLLRYRIHGSNMHGNIRAMRHDMLRGFAKAFAGAGGELAPRRRYCYGRLHSVLSGSFFATGYGFESVKHGLKAGWYYPPSLARLAGRMFDRRTRAGDT